LALCGRRREGGDEVKKSIAWVLLSMLCVLSFTAFAWGGEVGVGIRVILASHQAKGIDARLQDIQKNLGTLFNYSSYQLLQERSLLLSEGETDQLPLADNKELQIKLILEQGGTAEIAVEILRAGRGIFKTTAKLKKGGTLLIGGPKHEDGVLILAIAAQ
jgi:hypothetical protein